MKSKVKGPGFGPVLVQCAYKFLGAEGEGVFFLIGAVRDGVGFGTKGGGPEKTKMSKAAAGKGENLSAGGLKWKQ